MKKTVSFFLAVLLAAGCLIISVQASTSGSISKEGFGYYGNRLWMGESPLEPQANIYRMVLDELQKSPGRETIRLEWEATPLHYGSYFLNEALLALELDYPKLSPEAYRVTAWEHELVTSYVSKLTLELTRPAQPGGAMEDLPYAMADVSGAGSDYHKATAAFSWLMTRYNAQGGATAEAAFTPAQTANGSGLARGFHALMSSSGVPCVLGRNYSKLWAYVKIEGKWYVVDFVQAGNLVDKGFPDHASRFFLTGDENHTESEIFPSYMKFVNGSRLSVESSHCPGNGEEAIISWGDVENGSISVSIGGTIVKNGDSVPAGSTLSVTLTLNPGNSFASLLPQPLIAYEGTLVETEWKLPNVRQSLVLKTEYQERSLPSFIAYTTQVNGDMEIYERYAGQDTLLSADSNPQGIQNGAQVVFRCIPAPGFRLEKVELKDIVNEENIHLTLNETEFNRDGLCVIPALNGTGVWAEASFKKDTARYPIHIAASQGGVIYVENASDHGYAVADGDEVPAGSVISVRPVAASGYRLSRLTVNGHDRTGDLNNEGLSLANIQAEIFLSAEFEKEAPPQPVPPSGGGEDPEVPAEPEVKINGDGSASITLPEEGVPQTVRIPVSQWKPSTTAVLVFPDGSERLLRKAVAVDGMVPITLNQSARVEFREAGLSFSDTSGHWSKASAEFAAAHQLFQGTGANRFSPDAYMTRGMLATVLSRLEDSPRASSPASFPDVPQSAYYKDAVDWAFEFGIVKGSNGRFLPNSSITREELAVMLYRYGEKFQIDTSKSVSLESFPDGDTASSWAREALGWAVAAGLLQGDGKGRLSPQKPATRGEVAVILERLLYYAAN